MMPIGTIGISLLLLTGIAAAIPFDDGDDGYFYVGEFRQHETGGILGSYALSGLTGCIISVYSASGAHLLDIAYKSDHIDISFQFLEDAALERLLEKEEWLDQYVQDIAFQRLSFERPEIHFSYDNCTIEMHDSTISFLKIQTTGTVEFTGLSNYTINCSSDYCIELSKENFSGTLMSSYPLQMANDTITGQKAVMLRGVGIQPPCDETTQIKTVEDAIKAGLLGGEITVVRDGDDVRTDTISYYNNVTIKNKMISDSQAEFIVSGDHDTTGKTVKINIGQDTLSTDNIEILFDGKPIPLADNLQDVLNPNDDGLQPEYVMVNITAGSGNEFFLLISVPHFSEHSITIRSVVQNPVFFALAAVGAITVVLLASWVMFKKE
jgi:hypothetical protein